MRNVRVRFASVGMTRVMTDGSNRLNYYYIILLDDDLDRPRLQYISAILAATARPAASAENRTVLVAGKINARFI